MTAPALMPCLLLALAGCATVATGAHQTLSLMTDPPGATCTLTRDGEVVAMLPSTPARATVTKSGHPITIECRRAGHLPASMTLHPEFEQATLGNIMIGGVVGLAVDAASGAMSRYPPNLTLLMTPERFGSPSERDSFFDARADMFRLMAEAHQASIRRDCTGSVATCEARIAQIRANLAAELAEVERQRSAAALN